MRKTRSPPGCRWIPARGCQVRSISPGGVLSAGEPTQLARWEHLIARAGEFTPDSVGGFSWSQLALVSLPSLFMEMLMIRWLAAEVDGHASGLSALALFLPGRGIHAAGVPDCGQDGPALWHNLAVNSVVAGSLLLLIVAANILVQKFPGFPYVAAYAGIFISPDLSASNHGVVPLLGDERSGVRNVNQRWT